MINSQNYISDICYENSHLIYQNDQTFIPSIIPGHQRLISVKTHLGFPSRDYELRVMLHVILVAPMSIHVTAEDVGKRRDLSDCSIG